MVLVVLTFHQMVQNYGQVRTTCTKNSICHVTFLVFTKRVQFALITPDLDQRHQS